MASFPRVNPMTVATIHKNFVMATFAVLLVLFPAKFMAADLSPAGRHSYGDKQCLSCHGFDGLKKEPPSGKTLSLHMQRAGFAKSVHSAIACASCNAEVVIKTHSQKPRTIASSRDYSIPGNCRWGMDGKFPEIDRHQALLQCGGLPYAVIGEKAWEGMNAKFPEKKHGETRLEGKYFTEA